MDDVVMANGVVKYDHTRLAQLAVRTPGIVWRVEKQIGDVVERGDRLVVVDSAEVGDAKAVLVEAAAVFKLKEQDLKRLETLQGIVPQRELREAEAAREVARAKLFNALQKLVNLGFSLQLEQISELSVSELADHLHLLGLPASLASETASANLIPIVSPLKGVVTHCELVYGETVEPYKVQYIVADNTRMVIDLDVREEDSHRLEIGAAVEFRSEQASRTVSGTLTWIGTEIDPRTHTVQARAAVANPPIHDRVSENSYQRLLKANAFGKATILVAKRPSIVVVPNESLHWQWELGQFVVFVPSADGRLFSPRILQTGQTHEKYVEVLAGLNAGDQIVTAGSRILSSELSERLQQHLGDNGQAVREFGGTDKATRAADRTPST